MARIQIDLPERFTFSTELALYGIHINQGGHLDNAMVLSVASEARSRFFLSLGYSEGDTEGLAAFTGDAMVQYISEGFHGEVMVVEVATRDLNKYGFDLVFRISEKTSGREVARGKYGLVFYDMQAKKVAVMPEAFRVKISG
jgi:acyl-CoA thioester hydrolase